MTKQLVALCVIALPAAVLTTISNLQPRKVRTEAWLEALAPVEVPGYIFRPKSDGLRHSYKMSETTYLELEPMGIVAQVYEDGTGEQYEAVVIAADQMSAFHDQRVCFMSQGWALTKDLPGAISTVAYGSVPVLDLEVTRAGQGARPAMFTWRSPLQFANNRRVAKADFFKVAVSGADQAVGFSFRFMGVSSGTNSEGLKKFAERYLEAWSQREKVQSSKPAGS